MQRGTHKSHSEYNIIIMYSIRHFIRTVKAIYREDPSGVIADFAIIIICVAVVTFTAYYHVV